MLEVWPSSVVYDKDKVILTVPDLLPSLSFFTVPMMNNDKKKIEAPLRVPNTRVPCYSFPQHTPVVPDTTLPLRYWITSIRTPIAQTTTLLRGAIYLGRAIETMSANADKSPEISLLPETMKGKADWRDYRSFQLKNGVRCTVVHDKESKTFAASAVVDTGAGTFSACRCINS